MLTQGRANPSCLYQPRIEGNSLMSDPMKDRSRRLFAMLASWIQECPAAAKLSRGIRSQNGFELWRLLWREFQPENHSKSLIWRRTLLSPKFPAREAEFSSALQEWEADLDRYEAEYGHEKAISDEDKRAVVITEAPAALRQHLAMHTCTLSDYYAVRDVVVSYLQAKRTWVPSAAYAGSPARRDPNAVESQVGDGGKPNPHKGKKGSGKGDGEKGKDAKGKQKGKDKQKPGAKKDEPKSAPSAGRPRTPPRSAGSTQRARAKEPLKSTCTRSSRHRMRLHPWCLRVPPRHRSLHPPALRPRRSREECDLWLRGPMRGCCMLRNAPHMAQDCHPASWHCATSHNVRRKVTPGPAHKVFALRSTWQFDDQLQAWKRIEHKVEWQRLADPHEHFAGGAIMLFEPAPGAASVARVGDLLVDTSVCFFFCLGCLCRLIAVGHAVRHSKRKNYQKVKQAASLSRATPRYAVNCTS